MFWDLFKWIIPKDKSEGRVEEQPWRVCCNGDQTPPQAGTRFRGWLLEVPEIPFSTFSTPEELELLGNPPDPHQRSQELKELMALTPGIKSCQVFQGFLRTQLSIH